MEGTAVFGWYPVPFIYTIRARSSTEKSTALGGEGEGRASEGLFNDAASLPPAVAAGCSEMGMEATGIMRCDAGDGPRGKRAGEGARGHGQVNQCTRRQTDITSTPPPPLSPSFLPPRPPFFTVSSEKLR